MIKLNWKEFHKLLDIAVATIIREKDIRPSSTSLMEFMGYSHTKSQKEGFR